jgi:Tol biopolymer transport system component
MTSWLRRFARLSTVVLLGAMPACGGDGTGPDSSDTIGPIGPFPTGLTGRVAFATSVVVTTSSRAYIETRVHVIDTAHPSDSVIYTVKDGFVEGLAWAPDGAHLLIQTFKLEDPGPNGENRNVWQIFSVNMAGALDRAFFGGPGPAIHPGYSSLGVVAYFGGWSIDVATGNTNPASGIIIDGRTRYSLPTWDDNSHLSWEPNDQALVFTSDSYMGPPGLVRLSIADSSVTQLVAPDSGEIILQPAVSPDGSRIAIMRFAGNRNGQEIWTVSSTGAEASQLTTGVVDASPAWTPDGKYIVFARVNSRPGIYVIPSGGGTPTRIVGASTQLIAWSR